MSDSLSRAKSLITALGRGVSQTILRKRALKDLSERELISLESNIGRQLFGPIPKGRRREFFNLDPRTWMWHEEWLDETGVKQSHSIRYEVESTRIIKVLPGPKYVELHGVELENFTVAVHAYYERTMREIYKRDPKTGQKIA